MKILRPKFVLYVAAVFALPLSGRGQTVVTVDAHEPRQTLEGWGTSLAWFANGAGGWADANRDRLAEALFDEQTGLGLTVVRFNLGGGDNPRNPAPIKLAENAMPGYEPSPGKYDWSVDGRQRWFLQRSMEMGAVLPEIVAYSPPYWMTRSGTSEGAADGGSNLQEKFYGAGSGSFADYLTTVVAHYHDTWGITFRTLDPLNEPLPYWWKADDRKQEGCHFSIAEQDRVLRDVGESLAAKGLMTRLSASDENDIDNQFKELKAYSPVTIGFIDEVSTHSYAGTDRAGLTKFSAARGKRLTMTEWGSNDSSGKELAQQIQKDMTGMDAVSWSIWQPNWPALMKINAAGQSFNLLPAYFIYQNFTRFIRPGFQFFRNDDASTLAAFDANHGTLVIVAQNWQSTSSTRRFRLAGFTLRDASVTSWRSENGGALRASVPAPVVGDSFAAELPPQSVVTFVVTAVSLTPPAKSIFADAVLQAENRFQYSKKWQPRSGERTLESGHANDSYSGAFVGRQAKVYGSFAADEGIAAFSVDGGAETAVDLYSPQARRGLMYATPLLNAGTHSIKVRVTGFKRVASSGYVVPAERIDSIAVP
jgi:O-glycosyl hydrolase